MGGTGEKMTESRCPYTLSIIIPTYNRPDDLKKCIASILRQTVMPDEIIIVDDGDLKTRPLKEACERAGIRYVYKKKEGKRGLTRSRNLGVTLAKGDIIFFLDDDVVLFDNYVEEIVKTYVEYDVPELAGVGGVIENTRRNWWHLYDVLFMISGWRDGHILRSGFATDYGEGLPFKGVKRVDFLFGGVSSYKAWIFQEFSFSESYEEYGQGEDKDFSYRVSRKYLLLVNPKARLYHYESPQMRFDQERKGKEYFYERYRFFKNNVLQRKWDWIFFWWASFGYILKRVLIMILTFDKNQMKRVKGILKALWAVILKKD